MSIAAKICGLSNEEAVKAVIEAGAGYIGFIHFPASPRHVTLERAAALKSLLPPTIRSVLVVVDPDDALLTQAQSILKPDFIQLHGKETPERVKAIKRTFSAMKIIKAISVRSGDDVAKAAAYADSVDMLMFDAKPPAGMLPGGNALSFDWALLSGREFPLPWFLSGGLNSENVADAIRISGAKMLDVSSGVESVPGVKDPELIKLFVKAVHRYEAKDSI
jgi:phosphoribosylanthranilate isomerase